MKTLERPRSPAGTFAPTRPLWTPDRWDDGYFDNRGRFRVYRPDCPRSFKDGYALRAHVVWWLETGEVHPEGYVLHHRNENKTDDRYENLAVIEHGEHTRLHRQGPIPKKVCPTCGHTFGNRRKPNAKFCSQECYHSYPKPPRTLRTHCHRGHEFTPENTYQPPVGPRQCKACRSLRKSRYAR